MYLLTCQYFERMEKKILPTESRIAFCRLFIVRVNKVCYERKVRGEILGCFFALYTGVSPPKCSHYKLLADGVME